MSSEESDSQVSAMFDDALPREQCDLLVRRMLRDEALRTRWSRYAVIGAAARGESSLLRPGRADVASRVRAALAGEPLLDVAPVRTAPRLNNWYKGALGTALAAGVAAMSIMVLRVEAPESTPVASNVQDTGSPAAPSAQPASAPPAVLLTAKAPAEPAPAYVVPPSSDQLGVRTSAQLANYVVAHSEYATPVARLNRLSSFMTSDIDADGDSEGVFTPVSAPEAAPAGNAQAAR